MTAWTRLLTGVRAGSARLRHAVGSGHRPASIQRPGEAAAPPNLLEPSSSALLRTRVISGFAALGERAATLPTSLPDMSALLLRVGSTSSPLVARLRSGSSRLIRDLRNDFRSTAALDGIADEASSLEEDARIVFPALIRRLRPRWKGAKDVLEDYSKLKDLAKKLNKTPGKKKEPRPGPRPQPAPPVPDPEPAPSTGRSR
jgi:hypothetical protein